MKLTNLVKSSMTWLKKYFVQQAIKHLSVEGKVVESHGTDEVYLCCLGVHHILVPGDPQTRVFLEHTDHLNTSDTRDVNSGTSGTREKR